MKKIILILIFFCLFSCNKKTSIENDLVLEILNDTLKAFPFDLKKDTINVLNYSVENKSDNIYYFKQGYKQFIKNKNYIFKDGIYINIFDDKNKEIEYYNKSSLGNPNYSECDSCYNIISVKKIQLNNFRLKEKIEGGYFFTKDERLYFFIHPKEKIYFKTYFNLTDTIEYYNSSPYYANLKKNRKYKSFFSIISDSTNYKKELPSYILKTIEVNNVKVYHGIIESKNKVPIKVIE